MVSSFVFVCWDIFAHYLVTYPVHIATPLEIDELARLKKVLLEVHLEQLFSAHNNDEISSRWRSPQTPLPPTFVVSSFGCVDAFLFADMCLCVSRSGVRNHRMLFDLQFIMNGITNIPHISPSYEFNPQIYYCGCFKYRGSLM